MIKSFIPIQKAKERKLRKMINIEDLHKKYEFIIGFHSKRSVKAMTEQDKRHIRILGILQLSRDNQIKNILDKEFVEKFIFDEENQVAYYCIKFIRKEGKKYADC